MEGENFDNLPLETKSRICVRIEGKEGRGLK